MIELNETLVADALHDALLCAIARLAPSGGDTAIPTNAIADALASLLANLLVATKAAMPADEAERLTALFQRRLEEALAARLLRDVVGHA